MLSDAAGAYSGKIFCCDPLIRDLRGLFRQNLLLRPAAPISPGLILTKSLAATRCPDIAGAYSDKISCCDPLPRYHRGSFGQNLLLRPLSRYCQGSFWQNLLLSPAVPISSGLILTKSLAKPRWSERSPGLIPTKSFAAPRWSDFFRVQIAWIRSQYPRPHKYIKILTGRYLRCPSVFLSVNIYFINGLLQPVRLHILELLQHFFRRSLGSKADCDDSDKSQPETNYQGI